MITERLERREKRALIHSRLWSHPPQQTEYTSSFLHLRPIQAEIKTFITLFEKYTRIYGLKMMKSEFKKAGTLQLKGIRRIDGELVCERRGSWWQQTVDILWRSMWILWMTSSLSSHSTSASVSELSGLVTHTAVSSPKCNSEKRPLSNSVAFQTLFKWHRYCGILKIHIVRKINTGIRYEPVYRPALWDGDILSFASQVDTAQSWPLASYAEMATWFPILHSIMCRQMILTQYK